MADINKIESDVVTLAKGLAICLMVVGHSCIPCDWAIFTIYSFHMPLFFVCSGYCFKEKYLDQPVQFVWRKIKGIYIPFVVISLIFLGLHNILYSWHLYDSSVGFQGIGVRLYTMQDFLQQIKYIVVSMQCNEDLVGGFWFLKELFWGNIIFYSVLWLTKRVKWLAPLLLVGLTYFMRCTMWHIHFVNVNWMSFYAATFIAVGYLFRQYQQIFFKRWMLIPLVLLSIGGVVLNAQYMGMTEQTIATCGIYLFTATAACIMIGVILKYVRMRHTPPSYILFVGKHSLSILALHFSAFKLVSLGIIAIYGLAISRLVEFPTIGDYAAQGWWIVYALMGVGVPLFLVWIYNLLKYKLVTP